MEEIIETAVKKIATEKAIFFETILKTLDISGIFYNKKLAVIEVDGLNETLVVPILCPRKDKTKWLRFKFKAHIIHIHDYKNR